MIKPGDTVLDLGAGLGVLGILSCRAGARRVHAVESSDAWALGRDVVRAAGLDDRVTWVHASSFDMRLDERVDVIVADVHAPFGLQESGLSALIDARQRLLKPGGADDTRRAAARSSLRWRRTSPTSGASASGSSA